MSPPPFTIDVRRDAGADTATLVLSGELDIVTYEGFGRAATQLREQGVRHTTVDLSDLDFMDSMGIRALIEIHKDTAADGGTATFIEGARISRIVDLSGMRSVLPFVTA